MGPVGTAMVVLNLQTLAAGTVVGALLMIGLFVKNAKPQAEQGAPGASWGSSMVMLALFVVAWTGTFEVERFVLLNPRIVSPWPMEQFKQMAWDDAGGRSAQGGGFVDWATILSISEGIPAAASGMTRTLSRIIPVLAVKFAIVDALGWRITDRVTLAPVVTNIQTLTAAIVLGALILLVALDTCPATANPRGLGG